MPNHTIFSNPPITERNHLELSGDQRFSEEDLESNQLLPALMTKTASKQTYYTIRFLVDRGQVVNAFRAYAYFRWVDDCLDQRISMRSERLDFIERQQALMNCLYQSEIFYDATAEERILVDLIESEREPTSGLQSYIRNMMAVMAFDAERRGRLISHDELTEYSGHLATAVTEGLHYFIGHDDSSPQIPARYLAVTGAHVTHMLRDTVEDVAAGYFNTPHEFLDAHNLDPCDVTNDSFKAWIKDRTQLARTCFKVGNSYLAQVKNLRCRIAGYAYTARFEEILNTIERDDYRIRPAYLERKSLRGGLKICWSTLMMLLNGMIRGKS